MENEFFYSFFLSLNVFLTLITMLAACLCCRRKIHKNEFVGVEGMVKIKNSEDGLSFSELSQNADSNAGYLCETESKRASSAPHRSLPDIPKIENCNDQGSELYETVKDKVQDIPQGRNPALPNLEKETSISQQSSMSQADDVSSPYARVKTILHDYDKVRSTEHPYAQVNISGPSQASNSVVSNVITSENLPDYLAEEDHQNIAAAPAIAGMVSASQDLPYMTPPIAQQPHFSGDSQDSSKGYTSISVREPLANIRAQTNVAKKRQTTKEGSDSHYATVSDDSDEMYAAIDDHNNQVELYTSGSETYAKIEPANTNTVEVEVSVTNALLVDDQDGNLNEIPNMVVIESLKDQVHSRQASSSSNVSLFGNLGSPKPEKRQANSPLPPTPKNSQYLSNSNLTATSSIPSGRNSVTSVIECHVSNLNKLLSRENLPLETEMENSNRKSLNLLKDVEGMYAKVIKKSKLSNSSSQNSSPVPICKLSIEKGELNLCASSTSDKIHNVIENSSERTNFTSTPIENNYETIGKSRIKSVAQNHDSKDHGYETIPVSAGNESDIILSRLPSEYDYDVQNKIRDDIGYERLNDHIIEKIDHDYETLAKTSQMKSHIPVTDYDPNYEILRPSHHNVTDDGYAKVHDINSKEHSEIVKSNNQMPELKRITLNAEHDYARITEKFKTSPPNNNIERITGMQSDNIPAYLGLEKFQDLHNYQTINETKSMKLKEVNILNETEDSSDQQMKYSSTSNTLSSPQNSFNYESLTGSESDPNYESVRSENNYERLSNDTMISPNISSSALMNEGSQEQIESEGKQLEVRTHYNKNGEVSDYFQV